MKKAVIMVALASMGIGFLGVSPKAMADGYVNYNYSYVSPNRCTRCTRRVQRSVYVSRTVSSPVIVRRVVSRPVYVEQVVERPAFVERVVERPAVVHTYHHGLIPSVYRFVFGG